MALPESSYEALLFGKALSANGLGLVPIFVDESVLQKYRGLPGFSLVRTNTIGRLRKEGGWSLDFGISPQQGLLHLSAGDLVSLLPPEEVGHWVKNIVAYPMSQNFVKTRISPGPCIDDGEVRPFS